MLRESVVLEDWETLMSTPDADTILRGTEAEIGRLMPTALDMIASVVDNPGTSLEVYDGLLAVAEAESPLLLLAIVRAGAGLAHIADLDGRGLRALAKANIPPEPSAG